jgi:aspartate/methionine/tyrosine aminotransferase
MFMYSSRFHWDLRPNRLTELLREKRRAGASVLDLTESNPTHAGIEYPREITAALADARALRYDPAPAGMPEAREAVVRHYAARGLTVTPERILLTASTSEGYAYLFKLLCDPGDDVLVPRPSYPLFEFLADMESVKVRQYPLRYHGEWGIDREALSEAITSRTRAIIVVNPNNPTGSYLKRGEMEFLKGLNLPLISDEVFADYAFAPDASRVATLAGAAFAMSGLSKVAGLPQMKLGWIVVPDAEAMERLEWIADTYLSVSTPVQCAAGTLLEMGETVQRQIRSRCAQNLRFAKEMLAGSPADVLNVEGGWCAPIKMPRIRTEEEWTLELLSGKDVLLQPGFFYDFESEAFLVASLLTPPPVFSEGVVRLKELIAHS